MAQTWTRDQLLHYGWHQFQPHILSGVLYGDERESFTDTEVADLIAGWFQVSVTQVTTPTAPPPPPQPEQPVPLAILPSDWQEGDVATFHNGRWQALPGGVGGGGSVVSDDAFVPLVVFTGESNSGGYAVNADATAVELAPRPNTLILNNNTLTFEPLDVGTNNLIGHAGLTENASHGWEIGLANSVDNGDWNSDFVYLVKTGEGASVVSEWDENTDAYWVTFVQRITAAIDAIKALGKVPVPYVFFSHGINDALASNPPSGWRSACEGWHARIRAALGYCPIFMTELPTVYDTYNAQIDAIVAANKASFKVETTDATMRDANHWDYAGMKIIAQRMVDLATKSIGEGNIYTLRMLQLLAGGGVSLPSGGGGGGSTLGPLVTLTWQDFVGTAGVGGAIALNAGAATPAGARAVQTLDNTGDWEVVMDYPASAETEAVVAYIDDVSADDFAWGGTNDFLIGGYQFGDGYNAPTDGATPNATGATLTYPCKVRMKKFGNDVVFSKSTDAGATYVDFNTAVGVLVGAPATLYVKVLFAVAAAGKKIAVSAA